jgi:hypothetical protein
MTKLKAMALNRMFSKVHLDSLTELKQMCESVRLLFSSQIIGSKLNLVSIIGDTQTLLIIKKQKI